MRKASGYLTSVGCPKEGSPELKESESFIMDNKGTCSLCREKQCIFQVCFYKSVLERWSGTKAVNTSACKMCRIQETHRASPANKGPMCCKFSVSVSCGGDEGGAGVPALLRCRGSSH